jgi:hypothetical protein
MIFVFNILFMRFRKFSEILWDFLFGHRIERRLPGKYAKSQHQTPESTTRFQGRFGDPMSKGQ